MAHFHLTTCITLQAQRLAMQQKRADQDKQQGAVSSTGGTVLTKVQTPLQQKIVLQKVQTPAGGTTAQKTTVSALVICKSNFVYAEVYPLISNIFLQAFRITMVMF